MRGQARARLDDVFARKGKRVVVSNINGGVNDDDFDGLSVCSSELSVWDSDVESIGDPEEVRRNGPWRLRRTPERDVRFGVAMELA